MDFVQHRLDPLCRDVYLQSTNIAHPCESDAVEILGVDAIRINEHEAADAVTHQRRDHGTTRAGTTDNSNRQMTQKCRGTRFECLCDSPCKRQRRAAKHITGKPEFSIVTGYCNHVDRFEPLVVCQPTSNQRTIWRYNDAGVRQFRVGPNLSRGKHTAVGNFIGR